MATKVELTGGGFQDSEGNLLANGYLIMKLSQDSKVNTSQICSGVEIKIDLNASGDVAVYPSHPVQSVWGNDQLLPINSFYRVTGFKANGQPAWGPNNQQVIGDGGTFDVGTWVPNSVISWIPSPQTPFVKVNGVPLQDQSVLDFIDTGSVAFTNPADGEVEATASGGGGGFSAVYSTGPTSIPILPSTNLFSHSYSVVGTGVFRLNAVGDGGPSGGFSTGIFGPPANTLICNDATNIVISLDADGGSLVFLTVSYTNAAGAGVVETSPVLCDNSNILFAFVLEKLS